MKKKFCLIGPAHPLRGGLATFNERLTREFQSMGWETVIYTFSLQYPGFLFPGKTQYSDDPRPEDLDIRVQVNSVNPLNWIQVGNEIRDLRPDLVLYRYWLPFMGPCLGTIAGRISGNRFSRQVAITDNVIPHEKRPGDSAFTRYFLSKMDGYVAMSKAVLHEIDRFDTRKPRLFSPHPLYDNFGEALSREDALKALGLDPSFRYILFFGFIRPYKGLDILLDAFADPALRELPIRLIIAGEFYQDPQPYLDQISRLGIQDLVIRHNDFIPNGKVREYFSACDLVVQPYKEATQSGVTQIAYHFHVPMIVTNVSGLPENVPDGKVGYVVEPVPEAVKDGIMRFFREGRGEEFRRNMEEEKKKYSWKTLAENLVAVSGMKS